MTIEMLEQQLAGLEAKGKDLREKEKLFIKVQGLEEQIAAARKEIDESSNDLQAHKEELAELKTKKNEAVKSTLDAMSNKMAEVLPYGTPVIQITEDGKLPIGWEVKEKKYVAYHGLSGGEKILFEQALIYALLGDAENKLLIYEAAEVDLTRLELLLNHLDFSDQNSKTQMIVSTCHSPAEIPDGWNCVNLGGQ